MIERDVIYFLNNADDGDQTNGTRQAARALLITAMGDNLTLGYRLQAAGTSLAITVLSVSNERYPDIIGESNLVHTYLQFDTWGRGPGAGANVLEAGEWLRRSLVDYNGTMNGTTVRGVTVASDGLSFPSQPDDGSESWTQRYSITFRLAHDQTTPNP